MKTEEGRGGQKLKEKGCVILKIKITLDSLKNEILRH